MGNLASPSSEVQWEEKLVYKPPGAPAECVFQIALLPSLGPVSSSHPLGSLLCTSPAQLLGH